MNSISRTIVSILLAFSIVGGAGYLILKTDKIPALNQPPASTDSNTREIHTDQRSQATTAAPSDGSLVKCIEGGKVTYSNNGCSNGVHAKTVEIHHAAGIVMPTRETVNNTLDRMRAERVAEDRQSDVLAAQNRETRRLNEQRTADSCADLNRRIDSLDAMARQNSTNWIRDERYKLRNRQFELHC